AGSVSCTTSGAAFADADAGPGKTVTATVSLNGSAAGNYVLSSTTAATTADVTKAATTTAVNSSLNPSTADDSVTLTATVTSVAPATGSVQFIVDGINFGPPVTVVGGAAAVTTAALTVAKTYTVSATYGGDGNFNASTGSLAGGQVVTAGAPARLALLQQPTDTQAGQA